MIQQPELGQKIADLRRAKGFTQEELVEKCNINVRTLQRIESGEVTPRAYTLRLIFEALDYSFDRLKNNKGLIINRLEQFYIHFIDLFNLKTHAMRKITILSITLTAIIFGIAFFTAELKAQKSSKIESLSNANMKSSDNENEALKISGSFSGWNCEDEFVAKDAECDVNGVFFKSRLIRIDKKTREFHTLDGDGIISNKKAEIKIYIRHTDYSADNIEKIGNKIILKGNAKLIFSNSDFIEADEIIIITPDR